MTPVRAPPNSGDALDPFTHHPITERIKPLTPGIPSQPQLILTLKTMGRVTWSRPTPQKTPAPREVSPSG